MKYAEYFSPIGRLILASEGDALTGLWIQGQKHFPSEIPEILQDCEDDPVFNKTALWLDQYFAGENPAPQVLKLRPKGSDFRLQVWELLREIPYGQVTTYGDLAKEIARKQGKKAMSAQAVGGAVGHNPISIIIPCHRVVGSDGSMTGYDGGIDKKQYLLSLEGVLP